MSEEKPLGRKMWMSQWTRTDGAVTHEICEERPMGFPAYDEVIVFTPEELREFKEKLLTRFFRIAMQRAIKGEDITINEFLKMSEEQETK